MAKVLTLLAGAALLLAAACGNDVNIGGGSNWPWPWTITADYWQEKTVSDTVPVGTQTLVRLEAVNGEIDITGQPGATAVTLSATLRCGSDVSDLDAQAGLDLLDVGITDGADEILIETLQPQDPQGRQFLVFYTLTVPDDMAVDVHQANGNVTVADAGNTVTAHQGNGNVQLADVLGETTVQIGNGGIDASLTQPPGGDIGLTTANGRIDLTIPATTAAEFSAVVGTGTITWDPNLPLDGAVETATSLTGTMGAGTWRIDLQTGNGSIDVSKL